MWWEANFSTHPFTQLTCCLACSGTLNWSAPKETTHGLMPPVPTQIMNIPMKDIGLQCSVQRREGGLKLTFGISRSPGCHLAPPGPRPRMRESPGRWRTSSRCRGWFGTSRRRSLPRRLRATRWRSSRTCTRGKRLNSHHSLSVGKKKIFKFSFLFNTHFFIAIIETFEEIYEVDGEDCWNNQIQQSCTVECSAHCSSRSRRTSHKPPLRWWRISAWGREWECRPSHRPLLAPESHPYYFFSQGLYLLSLQHCYNDFKIMANNFYGDKNQIHRTKKEATSKKCAG